MSESTRYYSVVFTESSWRLFVENGMEVYGSRERSWSRVNSLRKGDRLLCYCTGIKTWFAILEVVGEPFFSHEPRIWGPADPFPSRVPVRGLVHSQPQAGVPAGSLVGELPRLAAAASRNPGAWAGFMRGSPRRWPKDEAEVVAKAIATIADR